MGDYRLSPAYDLLNSRIHIDDKDFALDDGLLPKESGSGENQHAIFQTCRKAEISKKIFNDIMSKMLSKSDAVEKMIMASFLNDSSKTKLLAVL
jgi:serine/threonine-protein kinase HipA